MAADGARVGGRPRRPLVASSATAAAAAARGRSATAAGDATPEVASGPLEACRFRAERDADRAEQIVVRLEGDALHVSTRANRAFDETASSFFERDWPDWLTGRIYDMKADADLP